MSITDRSSKKVKMGDVEVNLPYPLHRLYETDTGWIVVLDWSGVLEECQGRNVQFYDKMGTLMWTIQAAPRIEGIGFIPFANFYFDNNTNQWIGGTTHGWDFSVDFETGAIKLFGSSR